MMSANLLEKYAEEKITSSEIDGIILSFKALTTSSAYEANKTAFKMISKGFIFTRDDRSQKDIYKTY